MRTAISPRLATSTRVTLMVLREKASARIRQTGRFGRPLSHRSLYVGPPAIEDFHHLDETDGGIFSDRCTDLHEGRRTGLRRDVERAKQRRGDGQKSLGC